MKTSLSLATLCVAILSFGVGQSASAYMLTPITASAPANALTVARQNPNLSIMVEAIEASGMASALTFAGSNYTIFAPSNTAFESLFQETTLTKAKLLSNKPMLQILLGYHVVKSDKPLYANNLQAGRLTTFNKRSLTVTPQKNLVDDRGRMAHIVQPDIMTKNGTLHVIDKVLFPMR